MAGERQSIIVQTKDAREREVQALVAWAEVSYVSLKRHLISGPTIENYRLKRLLRTFCASATRFF